MVTRRLNEVETRAKLYAAETQASFSGPMASKGDSQEGLNRCGARNLMHMYKVTHKRVSIGVVHTT